MKLRNDAMMVQPCPVHGLKPELRDATPPGWRNTQYQLACPVHDCQCYGEPAPTRDLAMEEWDAMAYALTGRDGSPEFPLLALESGDHDEPDPFDYPEDN